VKILSPSRPGPALLCFLLLGCTGSKDTATDAQLPPADTDSVELLDDTWVDTDTGISGSYTNEEPPHSLTMEHSGHWDLLPLGGPFTSMVGSLQVVELLDGNKLSPWCRATFSLTGQATDEVCPTCDFGFLILFYLTEEGPKKDDLKDDKGNPVGGLADCQSPQLPGDGETRTLAYSDSENMIYFNYNGTNIWVPWYQATQLRDELNFVWEHTAGFTGVEEDN